MKILNKLLMAVAGLVMATAASAQVYGVASVGPSYWSGDDIDDVCDAVDCEQQDVAFKIVGGYKFHPMWGIEAGYYNFGKFEAGGLETKASGFGAGAALHLEFSPNLEGIGRFGLAYIKTENDLIDDSNAAVYGGIGLVYHFTPNFGLEGAWDFSQAKLDEDGADLKATVHAFTIGARFTF